MSDDNTIGESFFDVSALPGEDGEQDDPMVGRVLDGRYRLDRLLGEGGMGRVYAGTQLSVDREVAIKLLRGEALAQRSVKERFLREAKVISGFSHSNIVRLIDFGEDQEHRLPYLVMELVRGVSLADLTRRGRLALALALEIAYQVCGALVQAHSAGIVHRDLKPENLQLVPVVGDSFQAKVLDFGIAFPRESNTRITATGMICGTAYYVAPEQARGQHLDGRADLYALGIIMYEMLSGHLPFRADSDFQILLMQVQAEPPPLSEYLPPDEVPAEVIKLVHDLMAKDPEARPPSARAVRERIEVIRKRCAIAEPRMDIEDASADAFAQWLLAPATDAPVFEAATAYDSSTPPEVRRQLDQRDQTTVEVGPSDASAERPQGPETAPQRRTDGSNMRPLVWLAGGLVVAIAVAGSAFAYLMSHKTTGATDTPTPPGASAKPAVPPTPPPTSKPVPLSTFAGRCMVIGESDTWFQTVFLYPEVGELMLQGDKRLLWSPLKLGHRQGKTLGITYHDPGHSKPSTLDVRASGDKLVFRLADTNRFVCRKHAVQKFYDRLALSGTFTAAKDAHRTLVVPASGQRFTLGGDEYVYRILSGANLAGGHQLAVREADDKKAPWHRWKMTYDADNGRLSVERDGKTTRFLSKDAPKHDHPKRGHHAPTRTPAKSPSTPPTAASRPPAWSPPPPASKKVFRQYRKKVVAAAQKCADTIAERNAQVAHHQKLVDEGHYKEAERYRKDVLSDTTAYSQKIQAAAYTFSNTLQNAVRAGLNSAQIQDLSKIWQKRCR